MPNTHKNHEDCHKTVCFLCLQKCEQELTTFMIKRENKLVKKDLDFNNEMVSRGVYGNC